MSINKWLNEHMPRIRRFPCSRIQKDLCRPSALEEEGVGVHDHVLQKTTVWRGGNRVTSQVAQR